MATYFSMEDVEAAIDERVQTLQEGLEEKITESTQSITERISALQSAVESLEAKLGE